MANSLHHSPAAIIRQLLIDIGLGTAVGAWPVYASNEPSSPDNVITVYDTNGTDDGRSMIDGEFMGHNGFQVRVRAVSHPIGWAKADEIWNTLSKEVYQVDVEVEGVPYFVHSINRISDVLTIGTDDPRTKRSLFTINATTPVREVTS